IQDLDAKPTVLEFKPAAGGALNNDVFGPIMIRRRPGKSPMIVYATRAGDCYGIERVGAALKQAWHVPNSGKDLSAAPGILRVPLLLGTDILALPSERRLRLVECDNGKPVAG